MIENSIKLPASVKVGDGIQFGHNISIGENCRIGDNVVIHNNVVLYDGTILQDEVEVFDGSIIGRPPKSAGNLVHKIIGDFEPVRIGRGCVIGANVVIYAQCSLANNVLLGDGASLREGCSVGEYSVLARLVTTNHHVAIGCYTKIMDNTHLTAHCIVEDNVFIGVGVITVNDNDMRLKGNAVGKKGGPKICKGSRIGSGAIILPSVTIGVESIVGAGAVVTRDVDSKARVMGCPAKPL